MTESNQAPRERFTLLLAVACTALAALSVLLTVQNMSLKSKLAAALAASNAVPPDALKAGDTLVLDPGKLQSGARLVVRAKG